MKKATILPLCMAVVLSTSMVSGITAFANPLPPQIHNTQDDDPGVTPYYLYIQTLDVMVEPGPSEITYNIDIYGIDILKSVTGTATLYKRNSSGVYEKKTSRSHSFSGHRVTKGFSFNSISRSRRGCICTEIFIHSHCNIQFYITNVHFLQTIRPCSSENHGIALYINSYATKILYISSR